MALKRVIPCLDVDRGRVVKGTNFVDLRDAGDPVELAARYDAEGADELVFLDITASHERRDTIVDLARRTANDVFVPFTIGGGIRSVADAQAVLDAGRRQGRGQLRGARPPGADRRAGRGLRRAVRRRRDRREAARTSGWDVYVARRPQARRGPRGGRLGARGRRARGGGDPADQHGPRRHQRRLRARADPRGRRRRPLPVIASGGAGELEHLVEAIIEGGADAVLCASIFHYGTHTRPRGQASTCATRASRSGHEPGGIRTGPCASAAAECCSRSWRRSFSSTAPSSA